ncbi:hypothetical protein NOCA1170058 [metagenome]|uniref:Uncharacterized protein n=1 Tax=metagenome TaxID=256318 RepID=A0A2P2CAR1_9ZZZZ
MLTCRLDSLTNLHPIVPLVDPH